MLGVNSVAWVRPAALQPNHSVRDPHVGLPDPFDLAGRRFVTLHLVQRNVELHCCPCGAPITRRADLHGRSEMLVRWQYTAPGAALRDDAIPAS